MVEPPAPRSIRSFVIRRGRTTEAQERALGELWPRYGVEFTPEPLDLDALFGRRAPRTVEIGFGAGENLLALAARHPERDYLGIEVHPPGIGRVLNALAASGLANVRLSGHDAVEVFASQLPPDSLDEVLILFPDPWPKKRHHKRRLIQMPFVRCVASRLRSGGRVQLATDWAPYAEHMREVLDACGELGSLATDAGFMSSGGERAATRFERRGRRLGHEVWELAYRRR